MAGGVGGVPPQIQKKGRAARISNPATSGAQNAGEPKANGGGQMGGPGGRSPHGGGGCPPTKPWGVCHPHKTLKGGELLKRRGEQPALATPPRVGPKTLASPKPTGVGKRGSRGAKPPWRGAWGVSPHKFKRRGEQPALASPATSGCPKRRRAQSQRGWANGGPGGRSPHGGGSWGVSKEGASSPQNKTTGGMAGGRGGCLKRG